MDGENDFVSHQPTKEGSTRIVEIYLEKCLPEAHRQQQLKLEGKVQKSDIESVERMGQELQVDNDDEKGIMRDSDDDTSSREEEKKNRRELQFTILGLKPGTRYSKVIPISQLLLFYVMYSSPASRCNYTLMDVSLPKMYIWAVGSTGLEGDKTRIDDFITAQPSRRYLGSMVI